MSLIYIKCIVKYVSLFLIFLHSTLLFSQTLHVAFLSSHCYKMSHCRHIKFYSSTSVGTYINVTTCSLLLSILPM